MSVQTLTPPTAKARGYKTFYIERKLRLIMTSRLELLGSRGSSQIAVRPPLAKRKRSETRDLSPPLTPISPTSSHSKQAGASSSAFELIEAEVWLKTCRARAAIQPTQSSLLLARDFACERQVSWQSTGKPSIVWTAFYSSYPDVH